MFWRVLLGFTAAFLVLVAERSCAPVPWARIEGEQVGPVKIALVPLRGHEAAVTITNTGWKTLRDWTVFLSFPAPITSLDGATLTARSGTRYRIDATPGNLNASIVPGGAVSFRFTAATTSGPLAGLRFQAVDYPSTAGRFNYGEALQKSLYFYEAQRSGVLSPDRRVKWRGDSAQEDGASEGVDLSGGYYDAGDHVKFAFPLCASLTVLSWGGLEYRAGFERAGQWEQLLATIRWGTDWVLKAHIAPTEFYGQVGEGAIDHGFWTPPEKMTAPRRAFKIDAHNPGSDLAGEASASLAAASLLFEKVDPAYSKRLLDHARQLFEFADQHRGKYTDVIADARTYYESTNGYGDELTWAAAWLYRATREPGYLEKAERYYEEWLQGDFMPWTLSWDDKRAGVAVLLAQLTRKPVYCVDAEQILDFWTVGFQNQRVAYTPGGLAWLTKWGSLRYTANTAFLAFVYSDTVADYDNLYHVFARRQINYLLGANPAGRSYMVGFGRNPPRNPHHRASHGSATGSIDEPAENQHILYGALVGGPDAPDDFAFRDDRRNPATNEVALDYNAAFTGALARMVELYGGRPLENFPPPHP